jgi:hypothetical protein
MIEFLIHLSSFRDSAIAQEAGDMKLEAKFACRTGRDVQELEQFAITTTTTTFGDIAAH